MDKRLGARHDSWFKETPESETAVKAAEEPYLPTPPVPIPDDLIVVEYAEVPFATRLWIRNRLIAVAIPPGQHRWPHEWTVRDCEGRAVGVNGRDAAMARARTYAERWARAHQPLWDGTVTVETAVA